MPARRGIPLEALEQQEREIDAEIERLTQRREALRSLRGLVVAFPEGNGSGPLVRPKTLTDQVVQYVYDHPGLDSAAIATAIEAEFDARGEKVGGADARKTLLTTLGAVVKKKRVRRDDNGLHYAM